MMKKTIIMALLVASIAHARVLDLNESLISSDMLVQDNSSYRIMFSAQIQSGDFAARRYVVENLSGIEEMHNSVARAMNESRNADNTMLKLNNITFEVAQLLKDNKIALETLEKQKAYYETWLKSADDRKKELENRITSNAIFPPPSYRLGLVALVILMAAAVVLKWRDYSIAKEEKEARHHHSKVEV